jgi:hypothetical protein
VQLWVGITVDFAALQRGNIPRYAEQSVGMGAITLSPHYSIRNSVRVFFVGTGLSQGILSY